MGMHSISLCMSFSEPTSRISMYCRLTLIGEDVGHECF